MEAITASAIDKIVELTREPLIKADNGDEYILSGYKQVIQPTAELIDLKNQSDLERQTLEHEQTMEELRLSFSELKPFTHISTLLSLCDILKSEIGKNPAAFPLFVNVTDYNIVEVWGSYESNFSRRQLYSAKSDNAQFDFGRQDVESAIITLQTKFVPTDDLSYVLEMCSKITTKAEVSTDDNGMTQNVTVQKGVALIGNVQIKPRVTLRPYRTFVEIEQPTSEYLLRFAEGGVVSLTNADGGAWKLKAKENVAAFLTLQLTKLIDAGKVKVLR